MDIRSYLATNRLTQDDFGKSVGVTQSMVGHWLNGRCRIVAEKALQIEAATIGQVSRYELREDVFGPAPWMVVPVKGAVSGARVDPADYERIADRRWYVVERGRGNAQTFYAETARTTAGLLQIMMHRMVMGEIADGMVVDHINGDGLDNRRSNLRVCTQRENSRNRRSNNGYRGVSWKADIGRWRARIMVDRHEISLGAFDTAEEAARAYNEVAIEHYGEFAKLNVFGPSPANTQASA